ncbi:putative sterigmatocystin biosynthesis peroxidase stcC [Pseudocercospora fuligena]|uniref:Putative sterigmatocystin biosynthesis peroxidase stcC n=1 Tax=Pseudocercospora fuligena TaxID=685502 RepID=A0A8H6RE10_9PEZI|nr:putative sterigmatocystin biosynthesis peroxidase stcC [Pseudocercospora fuligena]
MGVLNKVTGAFINLGVMTYDNALVVLNLLMPKLKEGQVIPEGAPGHHLTSFGEFIPPGPGDSRSACPMLNAMANHGILPHDGKNISFKELNVKVRQTFNFAPSFCFFVPKFSADFLNKSYWNDRFDLEELSKHADDAIEHDASLTRHDLALQPDQGKPDLQLVDDLLKEATGKTPDGHPQLTKADLSRALSKRRADARRTNKEYSESFFHNMFGSANSSTMLTIFGGRVDDLIPMLTEERFSEKWEPRVLDRYGLTMAKFNFTVLPVERAVDVKPYQKTEATAQS